VVAGETLRQRPVRDLADAVQDVPGVDVTDAGLGRKGISIRGMQSDHTLVLVDGMRINNSASAIAHSDYELGWVPAEAIERVEVVRGPLSSLYGSEALGGVVNVITRKATDRSEGSVSAAGVMTDHGRGGQCDSDVDARRAPARRCRHWHLLRRTLARHPKHRFRGLVLPLGGRCQAEAHLRNACGRVDVGRQPRAALSQCA
ncbi:TonB-dependent receptor plug domain-containing protein, partial [Nocardia seriolae]|nr:TonB-dependent receptor plug domain-containing protein [Nocardia seriolae]